MEKRGFAVASRERSASTLVSRPGVPLDHCRFLLLWLPGGEGLRCDRAVVSTLRCTISIGSITRPFGSTSPVTACPQSNDLDGGLLTLHVGRSVAGAGGTKVCFWARLCDLHGVFLCLLLLLWVCAGCVVRVQPREFTRWDAHRLDADARGEGARRRVRCASPASRQLMRARLSRCARSIR